MRDRMQTTGLLLVLLLVLLVPARVVLAQTQQPPPLGSGALPGVICDGVTDTTAAIQHALDTLPVGSRVQLPGGSCLLSATLAVTRSLAIYGAGHDQTFLKQSVTTIPVMRISVINVHLEGMTLMHLGDAVAGGDGLIVRALDGASLQQVNLAHVSASWNYRGFVLGCMAYATGNHLTAQKNNSHGFEFLYENTPGCGVDQWDLLHANATLNKGVGFYGHNTTYAFGLGPWLTQAISFGNNQGGYVFQGSAGHPINDLRLSNVLSSSDNVAGISLDTYGGSHLISEPWIEYTGALAGFPIGSDNEISVKSNTGHCLGMTINNGSITVTGGLYWNCSWSGIGAYAPFTSIVGGSSMGNGQAMDADLSRRAGVAIGANGVHLSGHTFTFPGLTTLHYVHLTGTLSIVEVGHNSYAPDLTPSAWIGATAFAFGGRSNTMATGVTVHTNAPTSPALALLDVTGGPNPAKFFYVVGGSLAIQNAAASQVIYTLSDAGTPSWPMRRGQVGVSDTATTATVPLIPVEPDTSYFVQLTPVQSSGGPATGAFTISGVTKAAASFDISVLAAPGAGKTVIFDWFVYR